MNRFSLVVVALLAPATAHAGRTFYGWLYGTEVVPEGRVELDSWIDERNVQFTSLGDRETTLGFAPAVGIADGLELALPVEAKWYGEDSPVPSFTPNAVVPRRYGAELRYRFVAQDPHDPPELAPFVRVALEHDVTGALRPEADIVLSYQRDRIHALVDAGFAADYSTTMAFSRTNGDHHLEAFPGLGFSIRVVDELRLGAEAHVEWALDANEGGHTWAAAGPNVSWTHGRFWVSGAYGLGAYGIHSAPRLVWGITL